MMTARVPIIVSACLLPFLVMLGIGGSNSPADRTALQWLSCLAASDHLMESAAILFTHAGGAPFLLAVAALAVGWLWFRHRRSDAVFLAVVVLAGRATVEALKLIVERPRPDLAPYPVAVSSFSFPSGHAANSTITLLALVLVLAPPRKRRSALAAAVVASIIIGLTRPMLGVHWPSDVVAGWTLGIAWATAFAPLLSRRGETAA